MTVPWTAIGGNQSILKEINLACIFTGRSDAEVPILRPPDLMIQLIGTDPDAGKDGRQNEKGIAEDDMMRLHH